MSKPTTLLLPICFLFLPCLVGLSLKRKHVRQIIPFLVLGIIAYSISNVNAEVSEGKEMPSLFVQLGYLPYIVSESVFRMFSISRCSGFYLWRDLSPEVISISSLIVPMGILLSGYYALRRRVLGILFPLSIVLLSFAPAVSIIVSKTRAFYTADRYYYVLIIGFAFLIAHVFSIISEHLKWRQSAIIVSSVFAAICVYRSCLEVSRWRNPLEFGRVAVAENPENYVAWSILGSYYLQEEMYAKADQCFREGIRHKISYKPNWKDYYENAKRMNHPRVDQIRRHYHIASHPWQFSTFLSVGRLYVEGKKDYAFWLLKKRFPDKKDITDASLLNLYNALETKIGKTTTGSQSSPPEDD